MGRSKNANSFDPFHIPASLHHLGSLVCGLPRLWRTMGNFETRVLRDQLKPVTIDRPVYVAGLARAGTTVMLEILASHPEVTTHQYRDFPCLYTPWWWGRSQAKTSMTPVERAHGDRLMVTPASPEAMEEVLWMSFFPNAHNPGVSQVLGADQRYPDFEAFYRDHIRKLLLLRDGRRYVAKGNYNLTRIPYLARLFPDARFVVPVRHPRTHIASLIKVHRRFCEAERTHPRALQHMQRVGHFEFGLDRRPINIGDPALVADVQRLWDTGEHVRGWARYWASLHQWLHTIVESGSVGDRLQIVRYEDLCATPEATVGTVFNHCELEITDQVSDWFDRISAPAYYTPDFSDHEEAIIDEETAHVARHFGYTNTEAPTPAPAPHELATVAAES